MKRKPYITPQDIQIGKFYANNAFPDYLYLGVGDFSIWGNNRRASKRLVIVKSKGGSYLFGANYHFQRTASDRKKYDNFYIVDKVLTVQ